MSGSFKDITRIHYDLSRCNKDAWRYLKRRSNWKWGYHSLQRTELWAFGKELLIKLALIWHDDLICPICKRKINPSRVALHHKRYDLKKLFEPDSILLLHKYCHARYHNPELPTPRF